MMNSLTLQSILQALTIKLSFYNEQNLLTLDDHIKRCLSLHSLQISNEDKTLLGIS